MQKFTVSKTQEPMLGLIVSAFLAELTWALGVLVFCDDYSNITAFVLFFLLLVTFICGGLALIVTVATLTIFFDN